MKRVLMQMTFVVDVPDRVAKKFDSFTQVSITFKMEEGDLYLEANNRLYPLIIDQIDIVEIVALDKNRHI